MYITVKLIETSDVDLSGKVIATTNSQSLVTKEAFATIRPYHRGLEDFFNAMRSTGSKYYYERRPHQYDDREEIRQKDLVSAPSLIKSFVSVALEEPHKVHYYYGTLLLEYNRNQSSQLFSDSDYPGLYFAAHHISSRTKSLASKDRTLNEWSFHIALLVKRQIAPELKKGVALTDRKFLDVMKKIDEGFDEAYGVAVSVLAKLDLTTNQNRIPDVTAQLVEELNRLKKASKSPQSGHAVGQVAESIGLTLADGTYIGVVDTLISESNRVKIKYGPYSVEAAVKKEDLPTLKKGERVGFSIKDNAGMVLLN